MPSQLPVMYDGWPMSVLDYSSLEARRDERSASLGHISGAFMGAGWLLFFVSGLYGLEVPIVGELMPALGGGFLIASLVIAIIAVARRKSRTKQAWIALFLLAATWVVLILCVIAFD